jgi:hypothetical protein
LEFEELFEDEFELRLEEEFDDELDDEFELELDELLELELEELFELELPAKWRWDAAASPAISFAAGMGAAPAAPAAIMEPATASVVIVIDLFMGHSLSDCSAHLCADAPTTSRRPVYSPAAPQLRAIRAASSCGDSAGPAPSRARALAS